MFFFSLLEHKYYTQIYLNNNLKEDIVLRWRFSFDIVNDAPFYSKDTQTDYPVIAGSMINIDFGSALNFKLGDNPITLSAWTADGSKQLLLDGKEFLPYFVIPAGVALDKPKDIAITERKGQCCFPTYKSTR